jgi:WD40 repeat protein
MSKLNKTLILSTLSIAIHASQTLVPLKKINALEFVLPVAGVQQIVGNYLAEWQQIKALTQELKDKKFLRFSYLPDNQLCIMSRLELINGIEEICKEYWTSDGSKRLNLENIFQRLNDDDSEGTSPDGKYKFDNRISILYIEQANKQLVKRITAIIGQHQQDGFRKVIFSPNSKYLVITEEAQFPRILNIENNFDPVPDLNLPHGVTHASYTPDGKQLLFSNGSEIGVIYFYDASTFRLLSTIKGDFRVSQVAMSFDGRYLAASSWGLHPHEPSITIWELTPVKLEIEQASAELKQLDS